MVTKNEMDKYWKLLSLTEESDNPNGIIEHKIDWRKFFLQYVTSAYCFKGLSTFMSTLDSRIAKKQPASPGLVAKKVRKLGSSTIVLHHLGCQQ